MLNLFIWTICVHFYIFVFSIIFSAKPQVLGKRPRFKQIKNEKLSMKMNIFSKMNVIFIIYKMKIPKKWQIPLNINIPFNHFNLHTSLLSCK